MKEKTMAIYNEGVLTLRELEKRITEVEKEKQEYIEKVGHYTVLAEHNKERALKAYKRYENLVKHYQLFKEYLKNEDTGKEGI